LERQENVSENLHFPRIASKMRHCSELPQSAKPEVTDALVISAQGIGRHRKRVTWVQRSGKPAVLYPKACGKPVRQADNHKFASFREEWRHEKASHAFCGPIACVGPP
jgi:hypothetical protein